MPKVKVSTDANDVIVITAIKSGSGFRMKVVINITRINNTFPDDVEA